MPKRSSYLGNPGFEQIDHDSPADLAEAAARLEGRTRPALAGSEGNGTPARLPYTGIR
jgi:hypothetical protein